MKNHFKSSNGSAQRLITYCRMKSHRLFASLQSGKVNYLNVKIFNLRPGTFSTSYKTIYGIGRRIIDIDNVFFSLSKEEEAIGHHRWTNKEIHNVEWAHDMKAIYGMFEHFKAISLWWNAFLKPANCNVPSN